MDIRTMKHLLLGFSFFLISQSFAQDNNQSKSACCENKDLSPKAAKGNWSTEATFFAQTGSNSLRFGISDIKLRKFIDNNTVFRTRIIANRNQENTVIAQTMGNMERSITESGFAIAPGFEKHIQGTKRLSPYWGAEILLGVNDYEYNLTNSKDGQTFTDKANFKSATQGAYVGGINLIFGADYYVAKSIFIGAELGYGYKIQSFGENVVSSFDGTKTDSRTVPMGSEKGLALFANPGIRLGIIF